MKRLTILLTTMICVQGLFSQIQVKLNDSVTYQEIVGFGAHGSMNVWWSGGPFYSTAFLNSVVDDLGMTLSRNNFHAYDMTVYTNKQKAFFTALKDKAAASNEPMRFIQTVWSPPIAWKANNNVSEGPDPTKNYLMPEYYDDYSNFCADYIATTLKNDCGIDLYAFSLQNEPAFNEPYESCKYTATTYNDLLKVAGPIFNSKCPNVKLFGPEDMGSAGTTAGWTGVIFNDPVTVNYLDVLAVHGYSDGVNAATGDATGWSQMYANANSKRKQLWMTETSGYSDTWAGSAGAFDLGRALFLALKYGKISAWTWWQLCENSTSSVYALMLNGNGTPTKRYYVSKNFYRYIRPGAIQIESSCADKDVYVVAFKNSGVSAWSAVKPELTIVLLNNASSSKTISLSGRSVPATMKAYRTSSSENCAALTDVSTSSITLPAQTITTLVYTSTNKGPTVNQPADLVVIKNQTNKVVALTNVTNGDGSQTNLTLTASADNKTLISAPITIVQSSGSNYNLTFSTATDKVGTSVIKIIAKDGSSTDMLNTTVVPFTVKVIPFINAAPRIDAIADFTCGLNNKSIKHKIFFTGLTDGNDGSQTINKPTLVFSDATKIRLPYVNYTSPQSGGNIEFYPDQLGSTTVTMTLSDNGGTDLGGADTKTITFKITVVDNYTINALGESNNLPLIAYPNPASDVVNIDLPNNEFNTIGIYDLTGKLVHEETVSSMKMQLNTSALSNGMYLIIANGKNSSAKAKISILK